MKKFLFIMALLFLIPVVYGADSINCTYNDEPYIKVDIPFLDRDLIKWSCNFQNNTEKKCLTYVTRQGQLIQSNPSRDIVQQIGIIDYFEGTGYLNAYFSSRDIVPNFGYNFTVECFEGQDNQTISQTEEIYPTDRPLRDIVIPWTVYLRNSIIALLVIIVLIIVGVILWKRYIK